jgi:dethiobiotin synthetase/adenosylmethionine--8-amino-7-oxononanoate aminotransferase
LRILVDQESVTATEMGYCRGRGRQPGTLFSRRGARAGRGTQSKLVGPTGPGHGGLIGLFSDDGSTAMEVAVKMGIKTYQKRMGEEENENVDWVVLAQEDCYHGDTLGVMDVAEPSIFNEGQHPWYEPRGLFLQTPTLGFKQGTLSIDFPEDDTYEFDSITKAMDVDAGY